MLAGFLPYAAAEGQETRRSGTLVEQLPVLVSVRGWDGKVQQVRVGTAFKSDAGIRVLMNELSIGELPVTFPELTVHPARQLEAATPPRGTKIDRVGQLRTFAERARKILADPMKKRWHAEQQALLAEIEAELSRRTIDKVA